MTSSKEIQTMNQMLTDSSPIEVRVIAEFSIVLDLHLEHVDHCTNMLANWLRRPDPALEEIGTQGQTHCSKEIQTMNQMLTDSSPIEVRVIAEFSIVLDLLCLHG
jgi:hypothetical protein